MTPEELGHELIRLQEQGILSRGVGAKLVEETSASERRLRGLQALAKSAASLANAARIAAADRLKPAVSDEIVRERIAELQRVIETCQFVTQSLGKSTEPPSPDAS